jgi:hypothetical protein
MVLFLNLAFSIWFAARWRKNHRAWYNQHEKGVAAVLFFSASNIDTVSVFRSGAFDMSLFKLDLGNSTTRRMILHLGWISLIFEDASAHCTNADCN